MVKRVLFAIVLVGLAALVMVGQHLWAGIMKRPPWTTHLALAALPALPWVRMSAPPSIEVQLPLGFHDRGVDSARQGEGFTHLPYGFGDYRTQHPLGGGTTHRPLQVDVVVVDGARDGGVGSLPDRFFNSAAFVAIGGGQPDRVEPLPGDVGTIEHYDRTAGPSALRVVFVVDVTRRLRLEVVDELQRFDEAGLRAFALQVHAAARSSTSR